MPARYWPGLLSSPSNFRGLWPSGAICPCSVAQTELNRGIAWRKSRKMIGEIKMLNKRRPPTRSICTWSFLRPYSRCRSYFVTRVDRRAMQHGLGCQRWHHVIRQQGTYPINVNLQQKLLGHHRDGRMPRYTARAWRGRNNNGLLMGRSMVTVSAFRCFGITSKPASTSLRSCRWSDSW